MNERAKQLALQALKHPDHDNDGLTIFDNDELKKFAELIVGECINMIEAEAKNADEDDVHGMRNAAGLIGRAFNI
jgi:hypothetical protein